MASVSKSNDLNFFCDNELQKPIKQAAQGEGEGDGGELLLTVTLLLRSPAASGGKVVRW